MRITLQMLELDTHLYFQNNECYSSIIIILWIIFMGDAIASQGIQMNPWPG